jgi:hypothetical protein
MQKRRKTLQRLSFSVVLKSQGHPLKAKVVVEEGIRICHRNNNFKKKTRKDSFKLRESL